MILAYLESKYPEPALFGTSPKETALIWQLIMEQENYLVPVVWSAVPLSSGAVCLPEQSSVVLSRIAPPGDGRAE